jgi:hypothetical protein
MQTAPSLDRDWMVNTHTEDTDGTVVQRRSKRGGRAFDVTGSLLKTRTRRERTPHVHSPAAILIRVVHEVANDLATFFVGKWCPSNIASDDEAWDEEHGSAVLSGQVTVVRLKVFVIFVAISC